MVFDNILTEKRAKKMLLGAFRNDKLSCAYIFSGQNIDVMRYFAKELAILLNCDKNAFHECVTCKKIMNNTYPDFITVLPEGKKNIVTIDNIKETIDIVKYGPSSGKYTVVCIEDAEKMDDPGANCFLKTLEEPPANVIFILLSSRSEAFKHTIASRCQTILFTSADDKNVEIPEYSPSKEISSLLDFSAFIAGSSREIDREEVIAKLSSLAFSRYQDNDNRGAKTVLDCVKNIKKMANIRLALDAMSLKIGGQIN